jgi:hypothetical protein
VALDDVNTHFDNWDGANRPNAVLVGSDRANFHSILQILILITKK